MKTIFTCILSFIFAFPVLTGQSFYDDFESYNVNDYLANSSTVWTTWNNNPGSSEDVLITNSDAYSGSNSIYFESQWGGGPQDVVLPFGGVHTTGHFKFTSKWKVTSWTGAYFNFQGAASTGSTWALDVYMYEDGYIDVGGYIYTTYPQDQWFELTIDVDLDKNQWEVFIDGTSIGTFTNWVARVSHLDIYPLFSAAFWVDDVSWCKDYACNPDLSIDELTIDPNPLCSNHETDAIVKLTNNGPTSAKDFTLGLDMVGQSRISRYIDLNDLPVGKDTTITLPGFFKTNITGSNMEVKAVNASRDMYEGNDTNMVSITVRPSPSGFDIAKGSLFQGKFDNGATPDLIESGYTNTYEITPPGGSFTNSNYSSAWTISSIVARTESGVIIPASDYSVSYPSTGVNGKITFKGSDTYMDSVITFSISVLNNPNGCDSIVTRSVRIVPTPKVNFKLPASICVGDDVGFENLSTIHSGNNTYIWDFGDGGSSDADNPFHQFPSAGSYNVKVTATSHPWGIIRDTTIVVLVNEIPDVKYKVNNKCQGVAVEFTNQSTVVSGTMSFDWDFGDGSAHSTATHPTHLYTTPAAYKVTLKANANGCIATLTKNAYMFDRPVANFDAPATPVCAKSPVMLPNTSTLASGKQGALWSFGDGGISTILDGVHSYQAAGTYLVTLLSISEFECRDSITKSVTIKPGPAPDFIGNQYCGKNPTIFTNTTVEDLPNPVYTWTFSDNYTSNLKNVTRTWPYEGPFSATLKADYTNGCSGTTTKDFKIYIQPKANFNVVDICSGETAKFVNKSVGDQAGMIYSWDFGNSTSSNVMQPVNIYNPTKTTTYVVTLVVSYPQACSDTVRKNITVSEAPTCDFSTKDLGFMNKQFTPSVGIYPKYEWFFGEGGTSNTAYPIYKYDYTGNFNVTMRATNAAGCTCEVTKKVSANVAVNSVNVAGGISIYPNPNNGSFTVKNADNQSMKVEVFTVLGSKVYSQTSADGDLVVNLEDNAKGIYLVKVTINGVTSTSKVTVN